jgi:hypothetical protein
LNIFEGMKNLRAGSFFKYRSLIISLVVVLLATVLAGALSSFKKRGISREEIAYQRLLVDQPLESVVRSSTDRNAYFGELHLHTTWSFDAFVGSSWHTIDDAYRYARGEAVEFLDEGTMQLHRPLDFLAVTDHAEYLGNWAHFEATAPNAVADEYEINDDGSVILGTVNRVRSFVAQYQGITDPQIFDQQAFENTWQATIEKADEYYDPGTFTTFPAFEWTGAFNRILYVANNHRNVIFESSFALPQTPFTFLDGNNDEEKLWEYMQEYRETSGKDVLAIPHNMNISDGEFFKIDVNASPEYLEERVYNEPILEVVQNKGQSMEHPFLSPADEFADYRIWDFLFGIPRDFDNPGEGGSFVTVGTAALPNSYVRSGLKRGLQLQKNKGVNPFKTGFIGSSDDHAAYTLKEKVEDDRLNITGSSLAAVWAEENTRESIFSALRRKEAYATTGSRMQVRFFSGYDLPLDVDFEENTWVSQAYAGGVPMGGDLLRRGNEAPRFLVWAMKDAESAGLDRIQVVKVWIDPSQEDERQEKIYNAAWWGDRQLDGEGNLPPVIDTAGMDWGNYDHTAVGAVTLAAVWMDPDFDPDQHASYYLRVIEVPNMFIRQQERAWTSPIYYNPDEEDIVTGIGQLPIASFRLYPNPARSGVEIRLEGLELQGEPLEHIILVNTAGAVVQQFDPSYTIGSSIRLRLANHPRGVYLVVVNNRYTRQLVITG